MESKKCTKCNQIKELEEFYKDKLRKDGYSYWCKKCYNLYKIEWNIKNPNKSKSASLKYYYLHYIECNIKRRERRKHNSKKLNYNKSIWRKNNPGKANAETARRKAKKLNATPKWLTKEQLKEIQQFYINANKLTKKEHIKYEVDHIVPLQGKNVSGLHVPWNLQIISATLNRSKSNKFD